MCLGAKVSFEPILPFFCTAAKVRFGCCAHKAVRSFQVYIS